jgi:hypothetical protein
LFHVFSSFDENAMVGVASNLPPKADALANYDFAIRWP